MPRHPSLDPDERTFFRLIKAYLAVYLAAVLAVVGVGAWAVVKLVGHFTS